MKTYDFTSRKRELGRIVFALILDRKRMTERIIIGREDEARRLLNGGDGEVYYDEVRPLGSLLLSFESDNNGEWNSRISILMESYELKYAFGSARWDKVTPVSEFLTAKYNSGEPSAMFAAVRTWDDYLSFYNQNRGATLLSDHLFMLYKPFMVYGDHRSWHKEAADALKNALRHGESQVELWYPVAKRSFEAVVAFSSFFPIVFHYLHKIDEWRFVFQECKVCDKYFLARSRHYELCSDECRKLKAVEAKHEFNERAKDDECQQLYEASYQYWFNRWRKLKSGKAANPEKATAFKVEFDRFRKEAKERKSAVRNREQFTDFKNWLFRQQNEADRLME